MAAAPDPAYITLAASSQVVMTRVDSEAPLFHVAQRAQFLSFSPDGRWLAIPQQFDRHGELQLVDVATGRVAKTFRTEPIGLSLRTGWGYLKAAFSPDSRHVAVVGNIGGVHVYDVRSGRRVHTLTGHGVTVWDVAYSSDGTRLATSGYNDRAVKLWSVERGEELHTLRGHDAPVTRVAFAPDDSRLITVDEAGYALIWERGP